MKRTVKEKKPKSEHNPYLALHIVLLLLQEIENYEELKKNNARFNCYSPIFNWKYPTLGECAIALRKLDITLIQKKKITIIENPDLPAHQCTNCGQIYLQPVNEGKCKCGGNSFEEGYVIFSGEEPHTLEFDMSKQYTYEAFRKKILTSPLFDYRFSGPCPILPWNEVKDFFHDKYLQLLEKYKEDNPWMILDRIDTKHRLDSFDDKHIKALWRDYEIYKMCKEDDRKSYTEIHGEICDKNPDIDIEYSTFTRSVRKIRRIIQEISGAVFLPHELPQSRLRVCYKDKEYEVSDPIYPTQKSITDFLPNKKTYR